MRTELHPFDREHRAVLDHLDTWESRELLTHDEAESIRAFERQQEEGAQDRVPLLAEALGYLGAALAAAAFFALTGPRWSEIDQAVRLAILAAAAAVTLAGGWPIRHDEDPALRRLGGVLWTLSVGAVAGLFAQALLPEGAGVRPWAFFALAVGTAAFARVLQVVRPFAPLQVAVFIATLGTFGGAAVWATETGTTWFDRNPWWFGVVTVVVSTAWILAGRAGLMLPQRSAYAIGAVGAVIAPSFVSDPPALALWLGIAVSIGLIGASVGLRHSGVLALGALGLFGYLTGTIGYYLADTVGLPVVLLLSGVVLVGVATAVTRMRHVTAVPATNGVETPAFGEPPRTETAEDESRPAMADLGHRAAR